MASPKKSNTDKQVQDLFAIVQAKKAEIEKAEKPTWETNCSFRYDPNSSASINLHTVSDVNTLVSILGFLLSKDTETKTTRTLLNLPNEEFKWQGFTIDQWQADLQTRINKIQITTKRKELDEMEARLNKLVSPELRRQLELEELTKALKG